MAGTIATAYVQIMPSTTGIKGNLEKALGGEANAAGQSIAGKLGAGLKSGLGVAAKTAVAGIATAGTAAVTLGKQALDSYANYEQLIGGVETLFGDSADQVTANASRAFKTAGMSANEYMETVTGFSASLIQSLGGDTEAAASYADRALRDMSDNANKMGTDMTAIQNAYQGFAKQNYTMLDNLKLGYGGTQTEMQRLIADAAAMTKEQEKLGVSVDASNMSFGNIVNAISVMQEHLKITGTTAQEASTTIRGSVDATKSAWQNLLTGIADDNANFDALLDNFITSAMTAAENIIPRLQTIVGGLGKLILEGSQKILPIIIETITTNLPAIVQSGFTIIISLITGIVQALPELWRSIPQIIAAIVQAFRDNWPALREAGGELLRVVGNGIEAMVSWLWEKVTNIGRSVVDQIYNGIASKWNELVSWFNGLWDGLFGNRNVGVSMNVGGGGSVGHYATGLNYVPYDNFPAILHKGEAVLTASEASDWRSGAGTPDVSGILARLSAVLEEIEANGIPAVTYLDGKEVSDTVTKFQRRAMRSGVLA